MGTEYDIVARLREEGFITHMARLPRESKILHAAADEIERLRNALAEIAENRDEPYAADHARDALNGNR